MRVRSDRVGWIGVSALVLLAFLATAFAPGRTGADELAPVSSRPIETATALRDELLAMTNGDRADHGHAVLRLGRRLSRYATRHSREMAELGTIFHSSDAELRRALEGTDWSSAGENVGVGASLEWLQDAFMGSAPHRRNILTPSYDHAAIGVVVDHDRVWVTVVFYGN